MKVEIGPSLSIVIVTCASLVCVAFCWWQMPGQATAILAAVASLVTPVIVALLKVLEGQQRSKDDVIRAVKESVQEANGNGPTHA